MKQINVGFIGTGCRGKLLSSIVADMEEANIVTVCDLYEDRQKEAAEAIEKKAGKRPKTCGDYHELLKDDKIDAVIIAASWEAHVLVAIDCMQAGKVTALEVGGAYTVEDCYALVEAQERTGTHAGVRFRGRLQVTDRERFIHAFHHGIGSAKAFGYGMLLLQPLF